MTSLTASGLSANVYSNLGERASKAGRVFALNVGDTYRLPLVEARSESRRPDPAAHRYSPPIGEPVLLDAIQDKLRRRSQQQRVIPKDMLQVTPGGTAGLTIIASALFDPGDDVILLSPFWPLIRGLLASRGCNVVEVPYWTRLNDEPDLSLTDLLEKHLSSKTAAVYVNNPSNPTGHLMSERHVLELAAFCRKNGLYVLSDEAYMDLYFTESPPRPLWDYDELNDITIANHTVSKGYGLAGHRVGWIHGPRQVMPAIQGVQTFLSYCASKNNQLGSAEALNLGSQWQKEAREAYKEAGYGLADILGIPRPKGSTFVFLDVKKYLREGETTADLMGRIADKGVLVSPGSASGKHFQDYIRICFTCIPVAETLAAARLIKEVLEGK
jgi:N-succinyldiaminopimelate aminotransferase